MAVGATRNRGRVGKLAGPGGMTPGPVRVFTVLHLFAGPENRYSYVSETSPE